MSSFGSLYLLKLKIVSKVKYKKIFTLVYIMYKIIIRCYNCCRSCWGMDIITRRNSNSIIFINLIIYNSVM